MKKKEIKLKNAYCLFLKHPYYLKEGTNDFVTSLNEKKQLKNAYCLFLNQT